MLENLLDAIRAEFPVTEKVNAARSFRAMGMTFEARAYAAEGLGHVGVMIAQGPMQMKTLVINPFERDAPIFSYDRIHAMGKETIVGELYDSLLGDSFDADAMAKALGEAAVFPDKGQEAWYAPMIVYPCLEQKGVVDDAARFDGIAERFVKAYLAAAKAAKPCEPEAKRKKAAAYSEGLLEHGGPATDPVKAAMGEAFTANLFRQTLFGA